MSIVELACNLIAQGHDPVHGALCQPACRDPVDDRERLNYAVNFLRLPMKVPPHISNYDTPKLLQAFHEELERRDHQWADALVSFQNNAAYIVALEVALEKHIPKEEFPTIGAVSHAAPDDGGKKTPRRA